MGYFGVFRRTAPEVQTRFGCFGLPVPATSFREQSVMSGCRYLPRVVGSNCFETGAIVRHETGTGGPKYPIAPGDSWPAPVIRNNRTEFELRVLCVGTLRSIPRTAPPCFQYTDFSLRRRFFHALPSPPLLHFVSASSPQVPKQGSFTCFLLCNISNFFLLLYNALYRSILRVYKVYIY